MTEPGGASPDGTRTGSADADADDETGATMADVDHESPPESADPAGVWARGPVVDDTRNEDE